MRAFFWAAGWASALRPAGGSPARFFLCTKDWELACDNTGACRAAGYGVRMGEVSVLLTRNAGSEQHLTATVTFAQIEHDIPADSTASLLIDDRDFGALDALDDSHFRLDSDQTTALLQALTNQRKIEFTLNGQHLPLSSAGSREVLGKMDAFQRRTGTADALLDKGDAGDDAILPATPAPEIIAAPVLHNAQPVPLSMLQRQKLLPILTPLLNQRCDDWQNQAIPAADRQITLTALDKTHSLAQALCWRAPYNDGYALWLVDNAQLSKTAAAHYRGLQLRRRRYRLLHKERGMADCVTGETRVWDGKTFIPSLKVQHRYVSGNHPGGTWMLPTFVSR